MKATVYNAKKVAIAQIDGVVIEDHSPAGQMIKFTVPGCLDIGEYVLMLEDFRRVTFASWDAAPGSTTEQTTFFISMNKVR